MSDIKNSIKSYKRQSNIYNERKSMKKINKNIGPYVIEKLIKEGSSSKVYLAKSKYTGEYAAIKELSKSNLKNNLDDLLLITKQIETLKILKHRNIVSLYEIYESPKYFYLITEYLSGKDLVEKIIKKKRYTEEQALKIFFQLLDAMTYMHKMNICHRNIRTEHILFDKNNRPKIIGFGYSTFYEPNKTMTGSYGSLCYACPEIIDDSPYNPELADVWSLGVILYVLVCGYLPFSDEDDSNNIRLIQNAKIEFPNEMSNKLKDLIKHMLEKNPNKRYNFQRIVKHPWIKPYGESIFSGGINVCKTIFPVDERLLNIVNQYGFNKEEIKNDLIKNKYNIGTGVFKQIIRKLLDLKMENISDLSSEEFVIYKEEEKNQINEGEKKYEDYFKIIDEKLQKFVDYIDDFKKNENDVVDKLLALQNQNRQSTILDIVEEKKDDIDEEEEKDNEEEAKDVINDIENYINDDYNPGVGRKKSHTTKVVKRTRTPRFVFGDFLSDKKINNKNKNNDNDFFLGDDINPDNVEIVYNKDEEVDIIRQFQDEQNKKLSRNLKELKNKENNDKNKNKILKRNKSSPKLLQNKDPNSNIAIIKKELSLTQKKDKEEKNNKKILNDSILENKKIKNISIISMNDNNNNNNSNFTNMRNWNVKDINNRMDSSRKTKSKKYYLDRGSLFDTLLKKKHPENIRKTMLKESNNTMNAIIEGEKENKENNINDKNNKNEIIDNINDNEDKNKDAKIDRKSLRYSLDFSDDEEEEEKEKEDNIINNRNTLSDSKLFEMLETGNENEEELKKIKELKSQFFNEQKEEKTKEKNMEKDKENKDNKEKMAIKNKKVSFNLNNPNEFSNIKISDISKKIIKNEDDLVDGHIRIDSQLEISFHDETNGKLRYNLYELYNNYYNDTAPISKLKLYCFQKDDMPFKINDIHKKHEIKYIYTLIMDNKTNKKIDFDINNTDNISNINNHFSKINNILNKKNEKEIKNNIKEIMNEIPILNGKQLIIKTSSNNTRKALIGLNNINSLKKESGTQTKSLEELFQC